MFIKIAVYYVLRAEWVFYYITITFPRKGSVYTKKACIEEVISFMENTYYSV